MEIHVIKLGVTFNCDLDELLSSLNISQFFKIFLTLYCTDIPKLVKYSFMIHGLYSLLMHHNFYSFNTINSSSILTDVVNCVGTNLNKFKIKHGICVLTLRQSEVYRSVG